MNADVAQMNADSSERDRLNQVSRSIIGAAQFVSTRLGYGFLEKVYENALALELQRRRVRVAQQHPIHVHFDGVVVGNYLADLLVEDSDRRLGLVLNFGRPHLEVARVVSNF